MSRGGTIKYVLGGGGGGGGGGGIYHVLREVIIHVLGVVGNDKSHVQGGCYKFCPGGGGGGGEWHKSCPAGTTNHILGSVHTAVLGDVI